MPKLYFIFTELNASENEEVSSSMKNKKRKLKEAQVKSVIEGRPHETIKYLDSTLHVTDIDLWLDAKRKQVLRADFRNNYVPAAGYFRNNVFFVRLILVGEWRVVGYFRTSWKIFGVRAPAKHGKWMWDMIFGLICLFELFRNFYPIQSELSDPIFQSF